MATLVCFHAHPDDEAIATGGTIARAAAEGHRVVLVVATNGEHGEVPDDLEPGETLVDRRRAETDASARELGIETVFWLGYHDSGMTGWEQNADPDSFLRAPTEDAAGRLATILRDVDADVLTVYDWHGNYGHPDHIKVHEVGHAAARAVPRVRVLEATINRDVVVTMMQRAIEEGLTLPSEDGEEFDPNGPADDGNPFGMPEAELTLAVDVSGYIDQKRASIRCHRSQVTDQSFFLEMPDDAFVAMFGTEWYIERDVEPPMRTGWLFD